MENETKKLENQTFRKEYVEEWRKENHLTQENLAEKLDVNIETLKGYLIGNTKTPPIPVLRKLSKLMGVSLDFLFYNADNPDTFDDAYRYKWGIPKNVSDYFMEYKRNNKVNYLFDVDKDKEKDYQKIQNILLTKKINCNGCKIPFIELFNESVLNMFIHQIIYDKTLMETFKQNFNIL